MSSGSLGKNSKTSDGHETKGEPDNPLLTTNGELEAQSNLMKRAEFSFGPFQHMDKLPPRNIANSSEVNSTAKKFADFTEDEEDLFFRMHRLVGNRWELIAGRIPGRTAEEIEMFWAKKHQEK